jgi:hypothetical protein
MAQRLDKTVLLPEAHFILEADLDRDRRRKFAHGLRNTSGKVFLNATIACASSSPYWVLAPSRQLLLAGDSTRDYESGGQEFESLRARTFGTVVLAEPGRRCGSDVAARGVDAAGRADAADRRAEWRLLRAMTKHRATLLHYVAV